MHPAHRFQQVLLVSSAVAADFGSAGAYTGEGTTYGLTDPSGGNCNFMDYPQAAVSNFVAINKVQWDDSMSCGRCAQVTCTDPQCAGRSKQSEIVYVVDQCPGCNDGDLDLSPTVFKAITGMEPSRVEISWEFVTCPVSGKIKYCLKEGSNAFWAAIQPTHTVVGVDSVTIDGKPTSMVASSFYFLLDGDSTEKSDLSNLKITMTSVSGISVTNRSSDAGAGPTIVVSVLAVLGCLFILVILVMYFVVKKKKQLNEQLEREKHHDGSRCSAESDYHTNVAIDEQLPFPYTAAATPQPPCSPSI
ncbi:hypothetical protein JG687_00011578 [Phytophthora cactorum]|uniref:Expansin-like EG45 domain-containing protein n=1 Tax=Phytophthora cactorum TaxID=29920 RepID=A0A8T1U806_9STRA|nr:hypothetical protein JG687_00011578 [Phytophthora cactorum]